jgi:intraflagellar transport protein 81
VEIRQKLENFKTKKRELDDVRAEVLVLSRTEEVLEKVHDEVKVRVRELEAQLGVEGASELEGRLQKISEQKSTVDEAKGAALDTISGMVQEINDRIKKKQDQLVPKVRIYMRGKN